MSPTLPDDLSTWWRSLPPRAGTTAVLAVDGRSGAGKSALAAALAGLVPAAPVVAMDDLYPGWDGLAAGIEALVRHVLAPLAAGTSPLVPRWDWTAGQPGEPRLLPVTRHLLVEGVGCGARTCSQYLAGLVWLEAPDEVRRRRALARDGASYAPHWDRWAAQEEAYLRSDRPRDRACRVIAGG